MARFCAQTRAAARGTRLMTLIFRQLLAHRHRIRFSIAALKIGRNTFKYLFADDRLAPLVKIRERKLARRRPEQNHFLDGFGQRLKGCFQIKIEMRDQALQHLKIKGVAPVPAFDRARCERKRRMRNNPFRVKHRLLARPSHSGHAPSGLLNEKKRGSSSCSEYAQKGHAKFELNACVRTLSISIASARPPARRNAVSNDSARRCCRSGRTVRRSTITSIVC